MITGMPAQPATVSRGRRRGRVSIAIGLVGLAAAGAGLAWWTRVAPAARRAEDDPRGPGALLGDTAARAPNGTRIVVRVVNASGQSGLARKTTLLLRDFGYDVVDFEGMPNGDRERTVIEVHTGHPEWGARVRRVLGTGLVTSRADSLRYVDLTVLIGRDWRPPPDPLRP